MATNSRPIKAAAADAAAAAQVRIFRHQRRVGILFVEVFVDDARFEQHLAVLDEDGNFAVGVEPQKIRLLLLLVGEADPHSLPAQAFLREGDFDSIRVGRRRVVIERNSHGASPFPANEISLTSPKLSCKETQSLF